MKKSDKEKIKVLVVASTMHMGGQENQLMHLLRNADKKQFQIDFTSTMPDAYYRNEIEELGGKFLLIPPMHKLWPFPYSFAMYRIMKDGKYNVVHSNELFHTGITLMIAAAAGVKGRIAHSHSQLEGSGKYNLVRKTYHYLMRKSINRFSTVRIACSTPAGEFLYGSEAVSEPDFHVVYNSVDTSRYLDNYDNTEKTERKENWINVLNVGRICDVKNQIFLTEIAEEFKKRNRNIRILIAGDGDKDLKSQIEQAITENDLQDYIKLLGARSDVDILLRSSEVFILPSKFEGMPLSAIEAQATGIPCVLADTFSHEVDFGLGNVRWLNLNESTSLWADTIEELSCLPRQPKSKVIEVIKKKHYDSKDYAEVICQLYTEAVR